MMNKSCNSNTSGGSCSGIIWWAMLLIAVLAIPSIAIVVAGILPFDDLGRAIIFIGACWACTWIGMWLMEKSKASGAASAAIPDKTNE